MLRIFKISNDHKHRSLRSVDLAYYKKAMRWFDGDAIGHEWENPTFYVDNPKRIPGDFYSLGHAGVLSFTATVLHSGVGEIISRSAEILDAKIEDPSEDLFIANVTACYNCFDKAGSQFETSTCGNAITTVQKYAFRPERILDLNLFKIPEKSATEMYALVGRDDPGEEFYTQYMASHMSGLHFEEIWSSK